MASSSSPQENEENCETEEASSANTSCNMSSETHTHATRLKTGSISPKGFASKRRKYKSYRYYNKKTVPSEEMSVLNKSNHCHVQNSSSDVKSENDVHDSLQPKNEIGATSENEMNGSVSSGSEDSTNVSNSGKSKESGKDAENTSNSAKKEKSEDEEEKEDESLNEISVEDSGDKSSQDLTKETGKDHSTDYSTDHKDSEKLPQSKEVQKTNENKRQTIIVTETKSLAQVINNAVRKDMGSSQEGKPTLVIIETKTPAELGNVPKTQSVTNTITVETGVGKTNSTSLAPISLNSVTVTPSQMKSITTSSNGNAVPLSPSVIEDGGMAVEVPSLVVPYLIEYPPSRTISEFLKMLPLDAKELKEIEEASKNKLYGASNATSSMGSSSNAYNYGNPIGRPKTADRWGAYFENSLGKFFVDIGLSLAKEWVQTDLVKSQKRKTEKEGKNPQNDLNMESLIKTLSDTKDKNEPFHFPLKKCEYCSFKTESILVMKNHYNYPHEKHLDFRCNYCKYRTRVAQDIKFHMEAEHGLQAKLEKPHCFYHCPLCEFEDNSKAKVTKHSMKCQKKFIPDKNLAPPPEFDPPAKRPKVYPIIPPGMPMQMPTNKYNPSLQTYSSKSKITIKPKDSKLSISTQGPYRQLTNSMGNLYYRSSNVVYPQQSVNRSSVAQPSVYLPSNQSLVVNQMLPSSQQYQTNQIYQVVNSPNQFMPVVGGNLGQMANPRFTILPTASSNNSSMQGPTPVALVPNIATAAPSRSVLMGNMSSSQRLQTPKPNISITPVTKSSSVLQSRSRFPLPSTSMSKLSGQNTSSFVVCEICDGYIKDLEQLRTHMQWIHKVKIHPKMIFNRPPLNCQKCQFRFFTDQGLERHLLGAHGLVTSSMQENANKGQDSGRCTICGKVFQWKLLAHMSKDHNMILKPAHLSYKCTVCAATFGMYKLFETHVYQAHSTVAKRVLDTPDEKKLKSPLQIGKAPECKPNFNPPPLILECSECGDTFSKKVNYYQHWEKEHLSVCYIKLCRIDKCEKCLSAFTGKTPWSVEDESSSEDEKLTEKEIDVVDKTLEPSKSLNCRITDDTTNVSTTVETSKEEETVLDMDVVEGQDGVNDSADLDDEETALDMEVESHDVEHPSPDSVHTDEDDDC